MERHRAGWLSRVVLVASLAALGCAPPYKDLRPTEPKSTPEVEHRVGKLEGKRGVALFRQSWHPTAQARAALVIVHGLKDHSSRYDALARQLAGKGIAVFAFDLRGHGRSAGRRVAVDSFDDYVADLEIFLGQVKKDAAGPVFLFGHSMGGAIAGAYVATREHDLAGLILSGPALALDLWPITVASSRLSGTLTPNLPMLKLPNEDFSSSKETVTEMGKDPLVYQDAGPVATAAALADGIETIWAHTDRFSLPLLLLHGTKDKLTDPAGSRQLHAKAPATDKTLKIYKGYWHDLLHEPGRDQVANDIAAWLDGHLGGSQMTGEEEQ